MEISRIQPAIAVLISSVVAIKAYKRKSLDASGALAGFLVMSIHIAAGYRFGAVLLVFFFTSSKLTKIGEEKKQSIDVDFKQGGQRNWIQVLANSGIATVLVVIAWILSRWQDKCLDSNESTIMTCLLGGIIGHYGCCNGDTWSSEIGVLSDSQPRLITTFKPVRKGTNGGVTKIGLLAAAAAGTLIGASFYIFGLFTTKCPDVAFKQILVIPLGTMAGLGGSLIDSLLGATLQFSGFCTVRNKVNTTEVAYMLCKLSSQHEQLDHHPILDAPSFELFMLMSYGGKFIAFLFYIFVRFIKAKTKTNNSTE